MSKLLDGVGDVDPFEGRTPKLGLGLFTCEILEAAERHSPKLDKDYFQLNLKVLDSNAPAHPVDSEACIQIWPAKFNIHKRKLAAIIKSVFPKEYEKARADETLGKFCDGVFEEDLLSGEKIRIRVFANKGGYPEPEYLPVG